METNKIELLCVECDRTIQGESFQSRAGLICSNCDDDTTVCSVCRNHENEMDCTFINDEENYVCDTCFADNDYFNCNDCGSSYSHARYGEDGVCDGCISDEVDEPFEELRSVQYRPIDLKTKDFQSDKDGEIIKSPRLFGVEFEMVTEKGENLNKLAKTLDKKVGIARDGSIGGGHGIEVQTPILKGVKGEKAVIDISKKARDLGFGVNKTCGTHCHLDAREFIAKEEIHLASRVNKVTDGSYVLQAVIYNADNSFDKGLLALLSGRYSMYSLAGVKYTKDNPVQKIPVMDRGGHLMNEKQYNDEHTANVVEKTLLTMLTDWGFSHDYDGNNYVFKDIPDNTYIIVFDKSTMGSDYVNMRIDHVKEMQPTKLAKKDKVFGIYSYGEYGSTHVKALRALMAFYLVYDDIFLSMMTKTRRGNEFCKPIKTRYSLDEILKVRSQDDFDKVWFRNKGDRRGTNGGRDMEKPKDRKLDPHDSSRYVGVNFHSLMGKNGTLEIRYHGGTTDSTKILLWVSLHQRILDLACSGGINLEELSSTHLKLKFEQKLADFFAILKLDKTLQSYVEGRIKTYNK